MHRSIALVGCFAALVTSVPALPVTSFNGGGGGPPNGGPSFPDTWCEPKVTLFNLPAAITPPSSVTLRSVFFGQGIHISQHFLTSGTQNYTCNPATLTFFPNGTAQAQLFDVTGEWKGPTAPPVRTSPPSVPATIQHDFVVNPNNPSTVAPRFASSNGQDFIGTKTASVASSDPANNVAILLLTNISGTLAQNVVRTNTVGGVVPAAANQCTAGQATAVPYHANYLFFS